MRRFCISMESKEYRCRKNGLASSSTRSVRTTFYSRAHQRGWPRRIPVGMSYRATPSHPPATAFSLPLPRRASRCSRDRRRVCSCSSRGTLNTKPTPCGGSIVATSDGSFGESNLVTQACRAAISVKQRSTCCRIFACVPRHSSVSTCCQSFQPRKCRVVLQLLGECKRSDHIAIGLHVLDSTASG